MLDRLRSRDGDEECARIGVADVLGCEHDHPSRDEACVLATFEHRREVVNRCVRVATTHRLDERGREVVVRIRALVVDDRTLARCVLDVGFGDLAARRLMRELDDVQRGARVAAGAAHDQLDELVRQARAELLGASPDDDGEILRCERLELVHLQAREQGRVHLVVRVLRRRADQRHEALLDRRQQRVLLCLVEAMDLVEEQDRARAARPEPLAGALKHLADVLHRRGDRRELLERCAGARRDDARERRLARAGRAVEDRRAHAVLGDREPECRALAQHVLLPDELVERARSQPLRERRDLACTLRRSVGEEVPHAVSMLRTWPPPACGRR